MDPSFGSSTGYKSFRVSMGDTTAFVVALAVKKFALQSLEAGFILCVSTRNLSVFFSFFE